MSQLPDLVTVLPWPAGQSDYPTLLDAFDEQDEGAYAKVINDITQAITHIEGALGTSPAGASPTIKTALDTLHTALDSLQTTQSNLAAQVAVLATVPGPPNTYYRFTQAIPITTWVVNHPLGRNPAVMVTDSAGTVVEGEITYDSTSQITIIFSAAFAGEVYLS